MANQGYQKTLSDSAKQMDTKALQQERDRLNLKSGGKMRNEKGEVVDDPDANWTEVDQAGLDAVEAALAARNVPIIR